MSNNREVPTGLEVHAPVGASSVSIVEMMREVKLAADEVQMTRLETLSVLIAAYMSDAELLRTKEFFGYYYKLRTSESDNV